MLLSGALLVAGRGFRLFTAVTGKRAGASGKRSCLPATPPHGHRGHCAAVAAVVVRHCERRLHSNPRRLGGGSGPLSSRAAAAGQLELGAQRGGGSGRGFSLPVPFDLVENPHKRVYGGGSVNCP